LGSFVYRQDAALSRRRGGFDSHTGYSIRADRDRAWESLAIRKLGELENAGSNPAALTVRRPTRGVWESPVIRLPWEQENAGSNPAIPMGSDEEGRR
jgi:hypothetical protein